MHARTHALTHTRTHARTHTHTHARTHARTHAPFFSFACADTHAASSRALPFSLSLFPLPLSLSLSSLFLSLSLPSPPLSSFPFLLSLHPRYVGFDAVASAAEETRNPSIDLPIGIIGSLVIASLLYAGMCASLTGMVSYEEIDVDAPFADAFEKIGMGWATEIVSLGAVTGIITALLVTLLGEHSFSSPPLPSLLSPLPSPPVSLLSFPSLHSPSLPSFPFLFLPLLC